MCHQHWECTVYYSETIRTEYSFPQTSKKKRVAEINAPVAFRSLSLLVDQFGQGVLEDLGGQLHRADLAP